MAPAMSEQVGKPGKYQRSAGGLAVALVVTVVVVVAVLWFLGLFRSETVVEPEPVDYLEPMASAQQAGVVPVYPESLPDEWFATGVDLTPGDDPAVGLKFLTDEEQFVGVRQEDASVTALLNTYVDEDAVEAAGYSARGSIATEWEGYTDDGGDTAYATEFGDAIVLVYGSAPAEDLQALIELLTTEPITDGE